MSKPRCLADSRVTIITPRPVASRRPSDPPSSSGLPVTTAGFRVADVHAVGVHHPRHHLLVGVDVGRRHVLLGADRVDDLGDVAARQRFELAARHPRRIADDAALAAAERDVRDGALPRHPGGQRRHLVERHAGVIADAALGRAERDVVLHAIAGEDLDLAVVHLHRTGHGDLPLGMRQDLPDARLEVEQAGRSVELLQHRPEDRSVCRHESWSLAHHDALLGPRRVVSWHDEAMSFCEHCQGQRFDRAQVLRTLRALRRQWRIAGTSRPVRGARRRDPRTAPAGVAPPRRSGRRRGGGRRDRPLTAEPEAARRTASTLSRRQRPI